MQIIPLQSVPSQTVATLLGGQQCQLSVYQKDQGIFFDLTSNGVDMTIATIARNAVWLDPHAAYDGFIGNFIFIDTQGLDDPFYTGLGARWQLVYLTAAEYAASLLLPAQVTVASAIILTLATTLEVTAPEGGGNFSVAHGLSSVPLLISILTTSNGAVWAQSGFADAFNINLVGSDTGQTATVSVYTLTVNVEVQSPAATVAVPTTTGAGNFSVPHGLGVVPSLIDILPTSIGEIGVQDPAFNSTDLLLTATSAGLTASVTVFGPDSGGLNIQGPVTQLIATSSAAGPFSIPHGLPATPSRISRLMIAGGFIWQASPPDSVNVNLEASDAGVVAVISVFK
jgi:hypothetical protein